MPANTNSMVDPALNGLTIEACDDEAQCLAWFEAQAAVAHQPPRSVLWLKGNDRRALPLPPRGGGLLRRHARRVQPERGS
jgi:hypothetical protein